MKAMEIIAVFENLKKNGRSDERKRNQRLGKNIPLLCRQKHS
jgi:hypothetical protein